MPSNYMLSQVTSILAWIKVYLILDFFLLLFYWIAFYATGETGLFLNGLNPGVPVFAWFIPYIILIFFQFGFTLVNKEVLALPLFLLSFLAAVCSIIDVTIISNRLNFCFSDPNETCSFTDTMVLILALIIVLIMFIIQLMTMFAFIVYSTTIDEMLSFMYLNSTGYANANQEVNDNTK